ncbi:Sulfurtransferase TusD [secondary endosymbiont of Trabutina mannipara]|uniref:Sulfurtransferase TusD n=1 Tax=secondary endosymbiont of Trabutina mannipara TaxID=1835721 RepID=A0A1C3L3V0_9ENTR|nr:sulfurtransferase complex subunit TusD [secondary endosymbiont of Trabutina mannipara]SBT81889.1 Sulfurtransferase TusD [secondary endosymbiont of Trabutina mannipara]
MNLNYCIMITATAYEKQNSIIALQFTKTLLESNNHISTIFFYQNGVNNANSLITSAIDEIDLILAWCELAKKYKIRLDICVSAAIRRGLVKTEQTIMLNKKNKIGNFQNYFNLVSLSYFAQALFFCDRFIQF